jgi:hypothetical protein
MNEFLNSIFRILFYILKIGILVLFALLAYADHGAGILPFMAYPFSTKEGQSKTKIFVLLAKNRFTHTWGDFGGAKEKNIFGRQESDIEAAAREGLEEGLGEVCRQSDSWLRRHTVVHMPWLWDSLSVYDPSKDFTRGKIALQKRLKNISPIKRRAQSDNSIYAMFPLDITDVLIHEGPNHSWTERRIFFLRNTKPLADRLWKKYKKGRKELLSYVENEDFAFVPLETILKSLNPRNGHGLGKFTYDNQTFQLSSAFANNLYELLWEYSLNGKKRKRHPHNKEIFMKFIIQDTNCREHFSLK